MAKTPSPVPLQYVMLYLGLAISILCAIFMLRAANWARLLYIGWSGIAFLVLLLISPVKPWLIPGILMYAIFVFFLYGRRPQHILHILPMSQTTKNIFGRSTPALSALIYYVVNILGFVNQPPWHTKAIGKK